MDSDEHRRTLTRRGKRIASTRERTHPQHFTTTRRPCQAGRNEGPDQMPYRLWRTRLGVTPKLTWHPALHLDGSPNDAQLTQPHR